MKYCSRCGHLLKQKTGVYGSPKCGHRICSDCFDIISFQVTCFEKCCSKKIDKDEWIETTKPRPKTQKPSNKSCCSGFWRKRNISKSCDPLPYTLNSTQSAPLRPRNFRVKSITEYDVTLEWDSPENGSKPSTYILEKNEFGGNEWQLIEEVRFRTKRYSVRNLRPDKRYYFRIRSWNEAGYSLPETTSGYYQLQFVEPLRPRNFRVKSITEYDVTLEWDSPENGSKPSTYILEKNEFGGNKWQLIEEVSFRTKCYSVRNLRPDKRYYFRIWSWNEAGYSPPETTPGCYQLQFVDTESKGKTSNLKTLEEKRSEAVIESRKRNVNDELHRRIQTEEHFGNAQIAKVERDKQTASKSNISKTSEAVIESRKREVNVELHRQTIPTEQTFGNAQIAKVERDKQAACKSNISKTSEAVIESRKREVNDELPHQAIPTERPFDSAQIAKVERHEQSAFKSNIRKTSEAVIESRKREVNDETVQTEHHVRTAQIPGKVARDEQTTFKYNIRGLPNVGNTCYANSIFQVLAQTPFLTKHLKDLVEKFKLSQDTLTWMLFDVLRDINTAMAYDNGLSRRHETVSTYKMRQLVSKAIYSDNSFHIGRQNDSHSFMITMFNAIKSEINENDARGVLGMFEGTFITKFKYHQCGHNGVSDTQMFSSLLIPIDYNDYSWDIKDGIRMLIQEEFFFDNALPCDKCVNTDNDSQDAITEKTMEFKHLPDILILQLGKFNQHQRSLQKMHKTVYYPHVFATSVLKPNMEKQDTQCYRLFGVVLHYGSLAGGHYTAYVRYNDADYGEQWYDCSDSHVQRISRDHVLGDENAFLLFYHLSNHT